MAGQFPLRPAFSSLQASFAQVVPHQLAKGYVLGGQERRRSELRAHSNDLRCLSSRVLLTAKLNVGDDQGDVTYQYVGICRQGLLKNGNRILVASHFNIGKSNVV